MFLDEEAADASKSAGEPHPKERWYWRAEADRVRAKEGEERRISCYAIMPLVVVVVAARAVVRLSLISKLTIESCEIEMCAIDKRKMHGEEEKEEDGEKKQKKERMRGERAETT